MYEGHVICCGDHMTGSAYEIQSGMICCGESYVMENRSLCCTSDTRHQQVRGQIFRQTSMNICVVGVI